MLPQKSMNILMCSKFSYVISRYKLFLTHYHEQKVQWVGGFPGAKLWLTNFGGYTEESVVNQNTTLTEVKVEQVKGTPKIEEKE